jgi:hypothetical protein
LVALQHFFEGLRVRLETRTDQGEKNPVELLRPGPSFRAPILRLHDFSLGASERYMDQAESRTIAPSDE